MNTIKITFLLILYMLMANPLFAKDDNQVAIDESDNIVRLKPEGLRRYPQLPPRIFIECHYSQGKLKFILSPHSNIISLDITINQDEVEVWRGFVQQDNPETLIPILDGEYDIVCRTDGNQIFKGKLDFNN